VAALLADADAWHDADPGRRLTPALRAMAGARDGTDDTAVDTAARSLLSVLARHSLTYSPAVAATATATRLRRVLIPVSRPCNDLIRVRPRSSAAARERPSKVRPPARLPRNDHRTLAVDLGQVAAPVGHHGASSPARRARTSPRVRSRLVGSGSGRCAWIW
jgi:hypothetical protein